MPGMRRENPSGCRDGSQSQLGPGVAGETRPSRQGCRTASSLRDSVGSGRRSGSSPPVPWSGGDFPLKSVAEAGLLSAAVSKMCFTVPRFQHVSLNPAGPDRTQSQFIGHRSARPVPALEQIGASPAPPAGRPSVGDRAVVDPRGPNLAGGSASGDVGRGRGSRSSNAPGPGRGSAFEPRGARGQSGSKWTGKRAVRWNGRSGSR